MANPIPQGRYQWNIAGIGTAVGYQLFTYVAGTTTKTNTWQDARKNVLNSNPIVLDSQGSASIFCDSLIKMVLTIPDDSDPPTSPVWTVDNIDTSDSLLADNGNYLLKLTQSANGVNYIEIVNADTGDDPIIKANGEDANPGILLQDKNGNTILQLASVGSAAVNALKIINSIINTPPILQAIGDGSSLDILIKDVNGNKVLTLTGIASAVNSIQLKNSATGVSPEIDFIGTDANIDGTINIKGDSTLNIKKTDTRTNTSTAPLTLTASTSGTPAPGIGTGIKFNSKSADENPSTMGEILFSYDNVTAATERSRFQILTRNAGGALFPAYNFLNTGTNKYTLSGAPTADRLIEFPDYNTDFHLGSFYAYGEVPTSFVNNVLTKVYLNLLIVNSDNWFDILTSRFVPQKAGVYYISASICFNNTAASAGVELAIVKNGSLNVALTITAVYAGSTNVNAQASGIVVMNGTTDYIEMFASQGGGSTIPNLNSPDYTHLTGFYLKG
jgi:hypothetical protein